MLLFGDKNNKKIVCTESVIKIKIPHSTKQKYHINLSEINTSNNRDHKVLAIPQNALTPLFKAITVFTYSTTEPITIKTCHRW